MTTPRRFKRSIADGVLTFRSQQARATKPSIAKKYDFKAIISSPEVFKISCTQRGCELLADYPRRIADLRSTWLELRSKISPLHARANALEAELKELISGKPIAAEKERNRIREEARENKKRLQYLTEKANEVHNQMKDLAKRLPNTISAATPPGKEPQVIGYISPESKTKLGSLDNRDHATLGRDFDLINFSMAAMTSGWGWYFLKNEGALLEQALVSYALSVAIRHGFSVVSPPSMAYSYIAHACGYRPRDKNGEHHIYHIQQSEQDKAKARHEHVMSGTAEIPFAGMMASNTFHHKELPLKIVGSSRCYRAEAGAAGARSRGLYRVHEFTKVEMFAWVPLGEEDQLMQDMRAVQAEILQGLGLYCRILEMPAADLGFSAARKQDIEVYFPSRDVVNLHGGWGEVTSLSSCTDFQTRRLGTQIRREDGTVEFAATVNGTALAVPRILAAVLEYGWDEEGQDIGIPEVLWPWMHGIRRIRKNRSKASEKADLVSKHPKIYKISQ